jgi:hypothetical protein
LELLGVAVPNPGFFVLTFFGTWLTVGVRRKMIVKEGLKKQDV